MAKKNLLKMVKDWLKVPENTEIKLASLLGYRSSATISNWLKRKRIPEYMREPLERIILA